MNGEILANAKPERVTDVRCRRAASELSAGGGRVEPDPGGGGTAGAPARGRSGASAFPSQGARRRADRDRATLSRPRSSRARDHR